MVAAKWISPLVGRIVLFLFLLWTYFLSIFNGMMGRRNAPEIFWSWLQHNDPTNHTGCSTLYIYSAADKLIRYQEVEEVAASRTRNGAKVTLLKFDDSDHVKHLLSHPLDYVQVGILCLWRVQTLLIVLLC